MGMKTQAAYFLFRKYMETIQKFLRNSQEMLGIFPRKCFRNIGTFFNFWLRTSKFIRNMLPFFFLMIQELLLQVYLSFPFWLQYFLLMFPSHGAQVSLRLPCNLSCFQAIFLCYKVCVLCLLSLFSLFPMLFLFFFSYWLLQWQCFAS